MTMAMIKLTDDTAESQFPDVLGWTVEELKLLDPELDSDLLETWVVANDLDFLREHLGAARTVVATEYANLNLPFNPVSDEESARVESAWDELLTDLRK